MIISTNTVEMMTAKPKAEAPPESAAGGPQRPGDVRSGRIITTRDLDNEGQDMDARPETAKEKSDEE